MRIALGATGPSVRRLVLLDNLGPVCAGLVFGGFASWWTTWLFTSLIYGVGPYDVRLWAAATTFVLVTAMLAAWLPALRASRVDPLTVLRA